ncbi:putative glutamate--cysteine ligase [Cyanobium sp.]|jgi:predicted glutamate--cysteine ligase|nr:putative glutamate--cysteine ligase [Cyanobium sp.]
MSTPHLLLKGFEVEMYTGRADGTAVGCAAEAARELAGFVTEPDQRNLEYTTPPDASYGRQLELLLEPRQRLRRWLRPRGLTLLPGSTLATGGSDRFERSDPTNPYHAHIEHTYGTRVVTASVHINFGLTAMDPLFAGLRLLRCEGALLLALSASSPFLDGQATGAHSQRWLQFPLTPPQVPIFLNHSHYVRWMEEQLATGSMHNVRHLWTSVRPNGDDRPHDLNRIELRICDLIADPLELLAVTAFAELRLLQLLAEPGRFDPLLASDLSPEDLADLADSNDRAAARSSLEAKLRHWKTGAPILARDWIAAELESLAPLAKSLGLENLLPPLEMLLTRGNTAMRWLALLRTGQPVAEIVAAEAAALEARETALEACLATDPALALG